MLCNKPIEIVLNRFRAFVFSTLRISALWGIFWHFHFYIFSTLFSALGPNIKLIKLYFDLTQTPSSVNKKTRTVVVIS